MEYASRRTRCAGRSSSSPSSAPIVNSPAGTRTNAGTSSSRHLQCDKRKYGDQRKYTAPHESRTVRDGADAVHVGEPGGLQPVGKRRASADAARAARTATSRRLLDQPLVYTQSNGTIELRSLVAALYPGTSVDHVAGHQRRLRSQLHRGLAARRAGRRGGDARAELHADLGPGARVRRHGSRVALVEDARPAAGGRISTSFARIVSDRTRLIIICTPNNPTGARLTAAELDEIGGHCRPARQLGAVRRGLSRRGARRTARRRRCGADTIASIVTSGLSKAYGCPDCASAGSSAPPSFVASTWAYHDYTTIAPGALSDRLARVALSPARRPRCSSARAASCAHNLPLIERWLHDHDPAFSWIRPEAGAIVYVRYNYRINSTELVTRLRERESVLVVPGDHFGMDGYLRLGFGERPEYLRAGLERLHTLLTSLPGRGVRRISRMSDPELSLALVGFGNVARRFLRLLDESADGSISLAARRHRHAASRQRRRTRTASTRGARSSMVESSQSLDRLDADPRERSGIDLIRQLTELLADECGEGRVVVVETTMLDIDRGEPAIAHVRASLEGLAHVVTANKGTGGVRLRRPRGAGRLGRSRLLLRRRGHGRRAGLQSRARDDAGRCRSRAFAA